MCGSAPLQFLTLSVNGVRTQALVDSGAQVSVASEELFERLATKPPLASAKSEWWVRERSLCACEGDAGCV